MSSLNTFLKTIVCCYSHSVGRYPGALFCRYNYYHGLKVVFFSVRFVVVIPFLFVFFSLSLINLM